MSEKRRYKRLDLNVTLQLERIDEADIITVKYAKVDVTDISSSSLVFTSKQELPIGASYDVKIKIWTKEVIETSVDIVRCIQMEDGTYRYNCLFVGIPDFDASKMDVYQIYKEI